MASDPGTSHARKGRPSAETVSLLSEAHRTLRDELRDTLRELRPEPVDTSQLTIGSPTPKGRPELADRVRLVDLTGKLMTLLGTEIEPGPVGDTAATAPARRRRGRIDYGGA